MTPDAPAFAPLVIVTLNPPIGTLEKTTDIPFYPRQVHSTTL